MAGDETPESGQNVDLDGSSLAHRLARFREWTAGHPLRSAAVGGGLLVVVIATVGTWLYLASLTVSGHVPTLKEALEAYDAGELDGARLMVVRITEQGNLSLDEQGGPLFVLGAIKATEANNHWSPPHRASQYLVAAKYLREARSIGFPPGRELKGAYLLGKSLIESGDVAAGIEVLEAAVSSNPAAADLHLLIADAYQNAELPGHLQSLAHVEQALVSEQLATDKRGSALLLRVNILAELGRFEEAREILPSLPLAQVSSLAAQLAAHRLELAELRAAPSTSAGGQVGATDLEQRITTLIDRLRAIAPAEEAGDEAMYLLGQALELRGDHDAAIKQYERVRNLFSATSMAIAASVAEGDLRRTIHRDSVQALAAYRRSLLALDQAGAYRNRDMPLSELRQRMLAAQADFVAAGEFEIAVRLTDSLTPVLTRQRQLELQASTLAEWGGHLLAEARNSSVLVDALASEGRRRLREAGLAFEELAKRQFATAEYTNAVWQSAENYFLGQSYTSAIRMLDEYLKYEPVNRNARALLRLGQSHMAGGKLDDGIAALEECIELHPQDAAVFHARLDCAKAFRDRDDVRQAEQLLLANLNDSGQSPKSAEWRDSLFELGRLLHDAGRYEEAIDRLDEAVLRYPENEQTRLALYLIGESHRHAAQTPLEELQAAKTVNERESSTREALQHLTESLRYFEKVRIEIASSESPGLLDRAMLRNCYMMQGSVLFDLGRVENSPERFEQAIIAYYNVSTLYQNQPFVLETFVEIAKCQRRLHQTDKARLNIEQALQFLERLPADSDFLAATNFDRSEWKQLLTEMLAW